MFQEHHSGDDRGIYIAYYVIVATLSDSYGFARKRLSDQVATNSVSGYELLLPESFTILEIPG